MHILNILVTVKETKQRNVQVVIPTLLAKMVSRSVYVFANFVADPIIVKGQCYKEDKRRTVILLTKKCFDGIQYMFYTTKATVRVYVHILCLV